MKLVLPEERLRVLLATQLRSNFLLEKPEEEQLFAALPEALGRAAFCFSHTRRKYFGEEGEVSFNPYHTVQYFIFLYYLSNTLSKAGTGWLADKVYALNKMLSGADLYHEVELPDVFFTDHPVGTVLGRATYGRFFSFVQNCTVGNNHGRYPVIGENVKMLSYSRVLGGCRIGDNAILASGTYVKDEDVPPDVVVFGQSPHLVFKPRDPERFP